MRAKSGYIPAKEEEKHYLDFLLTAGNNQIRFEGEMGTFFKANTIHRLKGQRPWRNISKGLGWGF